MQAVSASLDQRAHVPNLDGVVASETRAGSAVHDDSYSAVPRHEVRMRLARERVSAAHASNGVAIRSRYSGRCQPIAIRSPPT